MLKFLPKIKINLTFIALTIAAGLSGLFIELSSDMREGDFDSLDHQILEAAFSLREPGLNAKMVEITALGSVTVLTIFTVFIVIFALLLKKYRIATFMTTTMIGAAIGNHYLKVFIDRDRPDIMGHLVEVSSQSYPSGHTMAAAAFYSAIGLIACRMIPRTAVRTLIVVASVLIILLVGFSRMYLGVHYPTDVIGGFLLGSALSASMAICLWAGDNQKD